MHGYSGNARDFDFLARELSRKARTVCPDMPGRGRSAFSPDPLAYYFPRLLADARALIAEIGARKVQWVGTSMGGLLGLLIAAEADSPIERLVLNDVGASVPGEGLAAIGGNLRAPARFESLEEVDAHFRRTHAGWGPITEEQWAHFVRHGSRKRGDGYALHYDPRIADVFSALPIVPALSLWSSWYRVRCPVLIIRGESSPILPRNVVDTMLEINPLAKAVEIAGAGHAPSLMAPEQIALVAGFLEGDSASAWRSAA